MAHLSPTDRSWARAYACLLLAGLLLVFGALTEHGAWRVLTLAAGAFMVVVNGIELRKLLRQRHRS
jgi:hypothetical protein